MTTTTTPNAKLVSDKANKWAEKMPAAADRIFRGVALVANVRPGDLSSDVFFIEGQTANYMIRVDRAAKRSTCTCPDHQKTQMHCKHIWATALYEACQEK